MGGIRDDFEFLEFRKDFHYGSLSFRTTLAGEAVVQSVDSGPFERATEHGVAVAQGVPLEAAVLGYDRHDWDRRSSFTWKFLRDTSAEQVRTVFQAIVHADNRLVTGRVLRRLLDPTPSHNEAGWPVSACGTRTAQSRRPSGTTHSPEPSRCISLVAQRLGFSADIEDAVRKVNRTATDSPKAQAGRCSSSPIPLRQNSLGVGEWVEPSRSGGPKARYDFVQASSAPGAFQLRIP